MSVTFGKRVRRNDGYRPFFCYAGMLVVFLSFGAFIARAQQLDIDEEDRAAPEETKQAPGQAPTLSGLDAIMTQVMADQNVPGGALAVAKDGRLVYAKGFGFANLRTRERASETTLFNLGSVTKTMIAVGILKLAEQGRLKLDDRLYDVLGRPKLPAQPDLRLYQITIRQLLHHSGGWYDDSGFREAGQTIRRAFGTSPANVPYAEVLPFLLATPLDYTPGTDAHYSNGQFNLLKYVLEHAAHMKFTSYLQPVLESMGIRDMKAEHPGYRPGEAVRYRGSPPEPVIPADQTPPQPLEPVTGNWLASAVDMAKFLTALDGSRGNRPITAQLYEEMLAPLPPPMVNRPNGSHFGLGLDQVWIKPRSVFFTKNGGKLGVRAQIEHLANGVDFALLFNGGSTPDGSRSNPLRPALKRLRPTLHAIQDWPQTDAFSNYP
jgi:N-acyl-D-amino-acid deacylase